MIAQALMGPAFSPLIAGLFTQYTPVSHAPCDYTVADDGKTGHMAIMPVSVNRTPKCSWN